MAEWISTLGPNKKMPKVVVDTSVLIRLFDENEGEHSGAAELGKRFTESNTRICFPFHALWEISSTLKRKHKENTLKPHKGITEKNALLVDPVPIDQTFFSRYFDPALPYLKAGDILFLAMAKKDDAILITEDKQQYRVAKETGIEVYTVEEYLNAV